MKRRPFYPSETETTSGGRIVRPVILTARGENGFMIRFDKASERRCSSEPIDRLLSWSA